MARLLASRRASRRWTHRRTLKAVYGLSDFESSDNECRKMLSVMFRGSWAIMSRRVVKTLR
jgi:hypothetical protein